MFILAGLLIIGSSIITRTSRAIREILRDLSKKRKPHLKKSLVYLAGPIRGLKYGESTDWRESVAQFAPDHIEFISPMRGKSYLKSRGSLGDHDVIRDSYEDIPLSSKRGIMTRDYNDVKRADAVLVNFLGATSVSIGTVMEIAWSWDQRKPVVVVMEKTGNIHQHAMLNEATSLTVHSLEEGIDLISQILATGV